MSILDRMRGLHMRAFVSHKCAKTICILDRDVEELATIAMQTMPDSKGKHYRERSAFEDAFERQRHEVAIRKGEMLLWGTPVRVAAMRGVEFR